MSLAFLRCQLGRLLLLPLMAVRILVCRRVGLVAFRLSIPSPLLLGGDQRALVLLALLLLLNGLLALRVLLRALLGLVRSRRRPPLHGFTHLAVARRRA